MNSTEVYSNITKIDYGPPDIQPVEFATLFFFGLVVVLGVPGNALVLWVTGFCMPRSVTSLWFLNLALADLLCCLSIPLVMVPPDHWPNGSLACSLINGLLYLGFSCSILQLVLISVDRWLLVSRPVWCQNNRRPRLAAFCCVAIWILAIEGSIPQFVTAKVIDVGKGKQVCIIVTDFIGGWGMAFFRFLTEFIQPLLIIAACHIVVYCRAESGSTRAQTRSKRTLRVIVAVISSFFLCWFPYRIVEFLYIVTPFSSDKRPNIEKAHIMTLCLAFFNSCLNPLLYVCIGRGFKDSINCSMRNILHFMSEDPTIRVSTASTDT